MEATFTCYYTSCAKTYPNKYNLVRHINTNHLNIHRFGCAKCHRYFPSKQNLVLHLNSYRHIHTHHHNQVRFRL